MKKIISLIICCFMLVPVIALSVSAEATDPVKVEAYKVASTSAITVDGQIEDVWSEANSYDVDYIRFNYTNAAIDNPADIEVKLLWDGVDMLYVLAIIKDSTNYSSNSTAWENDSMEVWIRINGTTRSFRIIRNGTLSGWGYSDGSARWPWKEGKKTDTADGWIAEYKIQLNYTEVTGGTKPQEDKDLYIDFIYNDASETKGGREALIGFLENKNEGSGNSDESSLALCTLSDTVKGSVLPPEDTGSTDTGNTDTGSTDTGSTDTGSVDTGSANTETTAPETSAPESTPTTEAADTTADKKDGCGSSVAFAGMAMVATVAFCGVAVGKKKD